MDKNGVLDINKRLKDAPVNEILKFFFDAFGNKTAIASSMGPEDQVLTHIAAGISGEFRVFTLDTGRLPQETYDLMDETSKKYGIKLEVYFPEARDIEEMVRGHGENPFYESIEKRKECCRVRKIQPLKRALSGMKCWVTGLRREQAITRGALEIIEWDEANGLIKANPLAAWTEKQVWDYIKANNVPYNKLHDKGYPSIGCAPCTRAIKPGEDIRAGRWWWETPEQKECGLHVENGKIIRKPK